MKQKSHQRREGFSPANHVRYLLRGIWESDRKLMALMLIETVCTVVTPFAALYLPKAGVELVTNRAGAESAAMTLAVLTAVLLVSQGLGGMASRGKTRRLDCVRSYYRVRLFCKTLDCDYEHAESPEWQEKYEQARLMSVNWGPWSATTLLSEGIVLLGSAVISAVLYGSVIFSVTPWMLLLILVLSSVNFFMLRRAQKYEVSRIQERSRLQKRRGYMENAASDMKYGKDIRLYELGGWIRACFEHYNNAHFQLRRDVQRRFFDASFAEAATTLLRDGAAYVWFLYLASSGSITVGEFVLACGAVASFSSLVTQISNSVGQVMQAVPPLDRMRAFLDAADEPEPEAPAAPPARDVPLSIAFEDVCFSYGGKNRVLDHFSLTIRAGEKIALVGLNGAGKTTLIKLLCGFYKPESGRILLGGTDIASFRKEDLYALIASVFQEATVLPFTVAENVAMTDERVDRDRVERCLRQAGLWDAVSRLPKGMDTGMTNVEEGGISFSREQRQRLLMARALYKGAQLLFFDEPTAALDPVSEHEVYNGFRELVGDKTAIFISHRLSSCRFCDEILVFDEGRLVQRGSHDELVAETDGLYHAMWQAQAQYYAEDRGLFA